MTHWPHCPVCGHLLRSDGTDGWICSARGGCGSEFDLDTDTIPDPDKTEKEVDGHE